MEFSRISSIKQESDEDIDDDDHSVSTLLLPIPQMHDNDFIANDEQDNEFLRLTSMVREVYSSHLYKSLYANYLVCCETKHTPISQPDLKKCAGQMELNAVRASLEASLYRQAMLKMISDVKGHTTVKKVHNKLNLFLKAPQRYIDIGVQTDEVLHIEKSRTPDTTTPLTIKDPHVQISSVTSNYDESIVTVVSPPIEMRKCSLDERVSLILKSEVDIQDESTIVKFENDTQEVSESEATDCNLDLKSGDIFKSIKDFACLQTGSSEQVHNDVEAIFGDENTVDIAQAQNDNDSQDSILQHMEDMFCESNDSTDLMALIEKHSGISKANIDMEICKMCPEINAPKLITTPVAKRKDNTGESSEVHANKRKLSFSSYKKMKKRGKGEECASPKAEETADEKKKRKASGVWLVERIHQVSKLKAKMMEISTSNYRRHGRIKAKFLELFGESDDEDMMPDSPICIEEHLNACKERIAPWVVKHLMPFYKKKRIIDRKLFKTVAKHVADMLIIENTFPEESDVNKHVQKYFKNKKTIKTKPDIFI
ncbi:uncharacterized protein [Neodiprion pinetum]|uniref:uncharacterized protein n=1 Tax=Neodiprion pinetum TaxID=441929 RepID=UPI001EDE5D75|nr:uncharacterized protein LOC124213281 isoform X1 [Neodiprion pinetum]XP_046470402.1 uncharacterized protein LOC124213281 isoform X1 [Neodiprion pinetum]XP_046470403.1 uncharacterized protein LOC124213281 isoform X1 [Neodiprion pinetum]